MGKRLGRCPTLCFLLQPVVADGLGQLKTLLQIAILHRVVHGILIVGPDTGVVVGKEFQTHADLIGSHLVGLVHLLMGLAENAERVLHMVADLVGNDIGIGEGITLDTQLALHLREEGQVDIQFLVTGAIERTYGSRSRATGRVDLIGKQYQRGRLVGTAQFLEHSRPDILRRGEDLLALGSELLLFLGELLRIDTLRTG